ncbi:hypothetical protein RRG08_064539 [Elysia crispata]|uniref:Uncharacterized protein n=1 Tax=Elysia crispata TaxID=231223 RepID=A0AAE1ECS2_9GAST|nr:hypothetical protein RRG08_064539 [Elysia crispata]
MGAEKAEEFAKYRPHESYYYEDSGLGPEGLRDYRPHLVEDPQIVGIGTASREQSLDSGYVLRPAPGATFERPRSCKPGEIGWGIPWLVDWAPANTGQQIMLGDFRQMAENRTTHEGTGAWYPHPEQPTPPGSEGYYKENIFSGRPAGRRRHGGPHVLVTVRVAMVTDAWPMNLRLPQEAQTMDNDASLPTFSAERPDPTQGVCPEPVDKRAPFRLFNAALHHDTTAGQDVVTAATVGAGVGVVTKHCSNGCGSGATENYPRSKPDGQVLRH